MKKVLYSLFITLMPLTSTLHAAESTTIYCTADLRNTLETICKVPEACALIAIIQKEGAIKFETNSHRLSQQFGAFWDVDQRTICVNLSAHRSQGEVMGSILFELHNALASSKLNYYDQLAARRQIDKESYVRAIEYIEYENSLKTAQLAQMGIDLNIYPQETRLHTYKDFDEHYYYQKVGGHSAWIASTYDQLSITE